MKGPHKSFWTAQPFVTCVVAVVALGSTGCVMLGSRPVAEAVTVDQSFTASANLGAGVNEGFRYIGQTYVAGDSGSLTAISLSVTSKRRMNPGRGFKKYPLRLAIHSIDKDARLEPLLTFDLADDEAPSGTVLTLPRKISQVRGQKYAIVIHYPDAPDPGPNHWVATWAGASGNAYTRGERIQSKDGRTWDFKKGDLFFATFLEKR